MYLFLYCSTQCWGGSSSLLFCQGLWFYSFVFIYSVTPKITRGLFFLLSLQWFPENCCFNWQITRSLYFAVRGILKVQIPWHSGINNSCRAHGCMDVGPRCPQCISLFKVHMQTDIVRGHISFNVTNCSNYPDEAQRWHHYDDVIRSPAHLTDSNRKEPEDIAVMNEWNTSPVAFLSNSAITWI